MFGSVKNWQFIDSCAYWDMKGLIVQRVAVKTQAYFVKNLHYKW
jgi:hypothetical protein